jgi:hypothetical protein
VCLEYLTIARKSIHVFRKLLKLILARIFIFEQSLDNQFLINFNTTITNKIIIALCHSNFFLTLKIKLKIKN